MGSEGGRKGQPAARFSEPITPETGARRTAGALGGVYRGAMNFRRALLAGVVAGGVQTVTMALARTMGIPLSLEMLLGTMTGVRPGAAAWGLGLIMHLVISALIALAY